MGFRLLLADAIVTAHGGTLYSGSGSRARGTCALALPLQETPQ
jgi:signal transduction histidine kinase